MKTAVIIIIVLLIAVFTCAYILFRTAFVRDTNKRKYVMPHNKTKEYSQIKERNIKAVELLKKREHESVYTQSHDKLKLAGTYFTVDEPLGTVICAHGFKSTGMWTFAGFADYMLNNRFNVLIISQRACAESEGKYITYGIEERYDILKWIDFINNKTSANEQIILAGVSLGASTVVMASGFQLEKNVKAIIADCGYISPKTILKRVVKYNYHIPCFPLLNIAIFIMKLLSHVDINKYSTTEALKENTIPIFFVHGDSDKFVPVENSITNYETAVCAKELFIVKGADHTQCFMSATKEYEEKMSNFLKRNGITI